MNVAIIGDGHIANWHAEALAGAAARVTLVVGKHANLARAFAARHGLAAWTTDLDAALGDRAIGAVIVATPSEHHAAMTLAALDAGKHVLVEAPMAMSAAAAERMAERAAASGLSLAVCHPLRLRPELAAIRDQSRAGTNPIRLISGQFINRSPRAPLGEEAAAPSWTDNLLWHHLSHMLDFALWVFDRPVADVSGTMGVPDARLGIPTEATLSVVLDDGGTIVCIGSYWGRSVYDIAIVSERDTYRFSQIHGTLADAAGVRSIDAAQPSFSRVPRDFAAAVAGNRAPAITGASVLGAMRVLQRIQDQWDRRYGRGPIPGRPAGA